MCLHLTLIYIVCMVSDAGDLLGPHTHKHTQTHTLPSANPLRALIALFPNALPLSSAPGCLDGLVGEVGQRVCVHVCIFVWVGV